MYTVEIVLPFNEMRNFSSPFGYNEFRNFVINCVGGTFSEEAPPTLPFELLP
jgi:hypothetical protein